MAKFTMRLQAYGNPDFGQYAPPAPPETVTGRTLRAMRDAFLSYIKRWNLGGGNIWQAIVTDAAGKPVAWISYNGRVWDRPIEGAQFKAAREIPI
jgi:hypothetical protein